MSYVTALKPTARDMLKGIKIIDVGLAAVGLV